MQTVEQVLQRLSDLGSAQTVKIYRNHGATCDMYGVKIADLKLIAKQIRGNQELAMQLFDTGNSDAMYLAGMVANGSKMTRKQLETWAKKASWYMISEYTVPWVTCEHPDAWSLGIKWIDAKQAHIAASGWSTLSGVVATRSDDDLQLEEIERLLERIQLEIHSAANRVRYTMNGFVISVGTYVKPLLDRAKATAKRIGPVQVELGSTACKVPLATEYIAKIEEMDRVGKKRKTIKC